MDMKYDEILKQYPQIRTRRLLLRRFTLRDAADVLEYGSDSKTLKYLVWQGVRNLEEAAQSISGYYLAGQGIYAIELGENQKCIGCIDLRIDPEHEKTGFGYVLNRRYWGKGYMTETLGAILHLCFESLGLNRVESNHYRGNEASGAVMKKCGMKYEGTGIQEVKVKGVFRDVIHYGITRADWAAGHPESRPEGT